MFFFFQAEDGIRDVAVTGVQTCALPICSARLAKCAELIHAGATDLAEKECRISIEESPQSPWPLLATARLLNHYDLTGNLVETSREDPDRKSTRLNSSHGYISYAVFCLHKQ